MTNDEEGTVEEGVGVGVEGWRMIGGGVPVGGEAEGREIRGLKPPAGGASRHRRTPPARTGHRRMEACGFRHGSGLGSSRAIGDIPRGDEGRGFVRRE